MRLYRSDGDGVSLMSPDELNYSQALQATALADLVASFIPHDGKDYGVSVMGHSFRVDPYTEKGEEWCRYVNDETAKNPPAIDYSGDASLQIAQYLAGMIPVEGRDYEILLKMESGGKVRIDVKGLTPLGGFWAGCIVRFVRRRPHSTERKT